MFGSADKNKVKEIANKSSVSSNSDEKTNSVPPISLPTYPVAFFAPRPVVLTVSINGSQYSTISACNLS